MKNIIVPLLMAAMIGFVAGAFVVLQNLDTPKTEEPIIKDQTIAIAPRPRRVRIPVPIKLPKIGDTKEIKKTKPVFVVDTSTGMTSVEERKILIFLSQNNVTFGGEDEQLARVNRELALRELLNKLPNGDSILAEAYQVYKPGDVFAFSLLRKERPTIARIVEALYNH